MWGFFFTGIANKILKYSLYLRYGKNANTVSKTYDHIR